MPVSLANAFGLHPELVYLNHAAVAPWPQPTADAVATFAAQNATFGAERYPDWTAVEHRLRQRLARLINAPGSDDIALVKNTSEALSLVAYGLDWRPGDEIVGLAHEFPSNRIVWESLATQGVVFKAVDILASEDPEADLLAAFTRRTRLLAVSSVHYATGLRLDLERLGIDCRRRGAYFCVDAIQSLGLAPFDVQACQADFVAADGHKWLLGPEGLGLFYCRAALRDRLRLQQFGWHMVEAMGDYDARDWEPAHSARRFECGSPNMLAAHGLEASLALIEATGVEHIFNDVHTKVLYLLDQARQKGLTPVRDYSDPERMAGIVTLATGQVDATTLWRKLLAERIVTAPRGGGIRFSPHMHNSRDQIDHALDRVARLRDVETTS
jgi:selenocysteine lyase/cysteine desulfurase